MKATHGTVTTGAEPVAPSAGEVENQAWRISYAKDITFTHAAGELETVKELAHRKRVCPKTIQNWMREGKLHAIKLGRRCVRFDKRKADEDIARFTIESVH